MTKIEFMGQFDRLCKGFKHEPTAEQTEAWYRRIGHVGLVVWSESVTTLLCSKYYPKLDEMLETIEREVQAQRKAAVVQARREAEGMKAGVDRDLAEWKERVRSGPLVCLVCVGDEHGDGLCWPWLDESERARRMRLRGVSVVRVVNP